MAKPSKAAMESAARAVAARFDSLSDDAFVQVRTVAEVLNCSVATVWRARKAGRLPEPRRVTVGIVAWRVGDLRAAWRGAPAKAAA